MGETAGADDVAHKRDQYINELAQWVEDARKWNEVHACFHNWLMASYASGSPRMSPLDDHQFDYYVNQFNFIPDQTWSPLHMPHMAYHRPASMQDILNANVSLEERPPAGIQYTVPAIWKRLVAELLDFLILMVVKLVITYAAFEFFDSTEVIFGGVLGFKSVQRSKDSDGHSDITKALLLMECLHRLLVCAYEAMWLYNGFFTRLRGSSPGKYIVGIRVVTATHVVTLTDQPKKVVLAYPGTEVSLLSAINRSAIKNILTVALLPLCFTTMFTQFNRTGYDVLCNSLVVEIDDSAPIRFWPA